MAPLPLLLRLPPLLTAQLGAVALPSHVRRSLSTSEQGAAADAEADAAASGASVAAGQAPGPVVEPLPEGLHASWQAFLRRLQGRGDFEGSVSR